MAFASDTRLHNRFELEALLGVGGVGSVWQAVDSKSGQKVALKVLHPHLREDAVVCARFRREATIGREINHSAVVRAFECVEDETALSFAMELLEGTTLKAAILSRGRLAIHEVVQITQQCLAGLSAAHQAGVIHRDFKSQNIFICKSGAVKILDFGFARVASAAGLTTKSLVLCTPDYAAPELIAGEIPDARADLYALGVVMYEALTGRLPYRGATPFELLKQHLQAKPPLLRSLRPEVPPGVEEVVLRLLEKDPAQRFASTDAVLRSLEQRPEVIRAGAELNVKGVCPACCEPRDLAWPLCPHCGASAEAHLGGEWMVVLMRAPPRSSKLLAEVVASVGAVPRRLLASGSARAVARLPRVVIKGVGEPLALLLRERCQRKDLQVELRQFSENNSDLLHRSNTPSYVFASGLVGSWAALVGLATLFYFEAGYSNGALGFLIPATPALAGPLVGAAMLRHTHWFLPPLADLPRKQEHMTLPLTLIRQYRDALEQVKVPALRGTLRRVLERALVIHGVGRGGPPHVEMLLDGPRRAALTLASQGIRMGLAAEQALRHLSLAGEAELLSDVETLRHRLQNGGDSSLASLLAKKQAALEQISELERASTLATQRLLRIATALEVASVHVLVAANPRSEEFSQVLKDLVSEAQVASEVTREINDPRRNV